MDMRGTGHERRGSFSHPQPDPHSRPSMDWREGVNAVCSFLEQRGMMEEKGFRVGNT